MTLWLIRAGSGGEHEQKFLDEGKVYVAWDGLNVDLKAYPAQAQKLGCANTGKVNHAFETRTLEGIERSQAEVELANWQGVGGRRAEGHEGSTGLCSIAACGDCLS